MTELNGIQAAIRSFDTIDFQIKGWCVTTSLAIGGFAAAYHRPGLLAVGAAAIIGFFLINCQFKHIQRAFIRRNIEIDSALKSTGVMDVLKSAGGIEIVGTAAPPSNVLADDKMLRILRNQLTGILFEARLPNTFTLYFFIAACMAVEAAVLL